MLLRNIIWAKKSGNKIFEGTLARESIGKKIAVLVTGYRISVAKLKEKWHIYPMEDIEEDSGEAPLKRKLVIVPREEARDAIVERLSNAVNNRKITDRVWATPGLPMLIFITAGLLVALLFGDIVWILVGSALGKPALLQVPISNIFAIGKGYFSF